MENLRFTFKDGSIHIEDFPDAAKAIELTGREAQKLADFAGHMTDLQIAMAALKALDVVQDDAREALWRSAVVHYIKCYAGGNKARHNSLHINKVIIDPVGRQAHEHIDNLRNSHMVHDRNPFLDVSIFAVLNNPGVGHKIAKIGVMPRRIPTLVDNLQNLINLVSASISFVEKEMETMCIRLTQELESKHYGDLLAMPQLSVVVPHGSEVNLTRKPLKAPGSKS